MEEFLLILIRRFGAVHAIGCAIGCRPAGFTDMNGFGNAQRGRVINHRAVLRPGIVHRTTHNGRGHRLWVQRLFIGEDTPKFRVVE